MILLIVLFCVSSLYCTLPDISWRRGNPGYVPLVEVERKMVQQGGPEDGLLRDDWCSDPLSTMYPAPITPSSSKIGKGEKDLAKRKHYSYDVRDPYSLLYAVSPFFEKDGVSLRGINELIGYLHAIDDARDGKPFQRKVIADGEGYRILLELAQSANGDKEALIKLYWITCGIYALNPVKEAKRYLMAMRKSLEKA